MLTSTMQSLWGNSNFSDRRGHPGERWKLVVKYCKVVSLPSPNDLPHQAWGRSWSSKSESWVSRILKLHAPSPQTCGHWTKYQKNGPQRIALMIMSWVLKKSMVYLVAQSVWSSVLLGTLWHLNAFEVSTWHPKVLFFSPSSFGRFSKNLQHDDLRWPKAGVHGRLIPVAHPVPRQQTPVEIR